MRKLFTIISLTESALGVILFVFPALVLNLIIGVAENIPINTIGRLSGILYFCFGLACLTLIYNMGNKGLTSAAKVIFLYNLLATIYFVYLKIAGEFDGILLLPVAILHGLITIYLVFYMLKKQ